MTIMLSLLLAVSVTEAKQVIADHTVNPSAVQFKSVKEGDGVVCGLFNAPNKQGGFEGFEPFYYYSKERWGTGLSDGQVMVDGELIDITYLNEKMRRHGILNTSVEDTDKLARAVHAQTAMFHNCPKIN